VQQRFGAILLEEIKAARVEFGACRDRLENISLDGPTKDVINGVEFILKTKLAMDGRSQLVDVLEASEKLLVKQRFQFPRDWISVSNVVGAFNDLKAIVQKRSNSMDVHLPALQNKIRFVCCLLLLLHGWKADLSSYREEDNQVQARVDDLMTRWDREKPTAGTGNPNDVLLTLSMFSNEVSHFCRLKYVSTFIMLRY
jgi:dynein heavy chain 1